MSKRLFLVFDEKLYFYSYCSDENNHCRQIFSKNKLIFFLAHVLKKLGLPVPALFWGDWKKKIKDYDVVVFSDYAFVPNAKSYIEKKNPKCKIYFYYMNKIVKNNYKYLDIDIIKNNFSSQNVYSYSLDDSIKYNINFKILMYKEYNVNSIKNNLYDFVFLGRDKTRGNLLENFYNSVKNIFKCNIKIYGGKGELGCSEFIDYKSYLESVCESKAILNVVSEPCCSIDLRVLEALYYNKKLITNNSKIKELDIYNDIKKLVFIIDYEKIDIGELSKFLSSTSSLVDMSVKEKYSFKNWIESFNC